MNDKSLEPLGDEQVDGVAGGYLYCAGRGTGNSCWQVLDDNGEVDESFKSYHDAYYYACDNGYTTNEINTKELEKLKATGWPF